MKTLNRFFTRCSVAGILLTCATHAFGQLQTSNQVFIQTLPQFESTVSNTREITDEQSTFGNGVTGVIGENGFITINGSGQPLAGVEFISQGELLSPVASVDGGPPSADPFQFLLSNTASQVTYGNLGQDIVLEGSLRLSVGYDGKTPATDLTAVWGNGTTPVPFPVRLQGESFRTAFNLNDDGSAISYAQGVYMAVIEAGIASGTPADTPADRVDPNDGTAMFPGVGSLEIVHPTLGTFVCTGSVIDDTHILTAAHCFDYDSDGLADTDITTNSKFYLNDGGSPSATINISDVDLHPDFGGFSSTGANDDLAVVTLSSAVPPSTTKYSIRNTGMSSGEILEMVGYGVSGQGDVGGVEIVPDLSVKRSGKNVAELFVEDDEGSGVDEIYMYDFDGPTGDGFLGGGTLGNDLESVVRGGDSGGPAFVEEGGMLVLAGVNSFEFVLEPTTPGTGEFGVLGGGVILGEAQFDWISSIATGAVSVPEPASYSLIVTIVICLGLTRKRRS